MRTRTRVVKLLPKQMQFLMSDCKYTLMSGGRGSGKSEALCWAALREASIPGSDVLVVRKVFSDLRQTTLTSLLNGPDAIVRPEFIEEHNKVEGVIKIRGGGIIRYRGLDRGASVRSMNMSALVLDESIDFSNEEFEELNYGLRNPHGSLKVYMATNPGAPDADNWLYKKFFIDKNEDHKVITSSSYDNFFLPESFFKSFKYMDSDRRKRMVDGLWVAIEGSVFKNFKRSIHVKQVAQTGYDRYILSIDWGQTHMAAFILAGVKDNVITILQEYAKSELLISQIKDKVKDIKEKYNDLTILYDPSAPILANELGNVGIQLEKANNNKNIGLDRIRNRLGAGTLFIDNFCVNLIREIENYCYKPGTETPIKKNDDCIDAMRYIVNCVDDTSGNYIYPVFIDTEDDEDDLLNNDELFTSGYGRS